MPFTSSSSWVDCSLTMSDRRRSPTDCTTPGPTESDQDRLEQACGERTRYDTTQDYVERDSRPGLDSPCPRDVLDALLDLLVIRFREGFQASRSVLVDLGPVVEQLLATLEDFLPLSLQFAPIGLERVDPGTSPIAGSGSSKAKYTRSRAPTIPTAAYTSPTAQSAWNPSDSEIRGRRTSPQGPCWADPESAVPA